MDFSTLELKLKEQSSSKKEELLNLIKEKMVEK